MVEHHTTTFLFYDNRSSFPWYTTRAGLTWTEANVNMSSLGDVCILYIEYHYLLEKVSNSIYVFLFVCLFLFYPSNKSIYPWEI